jgi:acyl-CoA thioesterase-1
MTDGVSEFMQADGIHPNKDGVAAIVNAMGPAVLAFVQDLQEGE